jgi:hypothetical protein
MQRARQDTERREGDRAGVRKRWRRQEEKEDISVESHKVPKASRLFWIFNVELKLPLEIAKQSFSKQLERFFERCLFSNTYLLPLNIQPSGLINYKLN